MMSWTESVVADLAVFKGYGWSFEESWRRAVESHPPRGRDLGLRRPSLLDDDESLVDFTRRACEDAWHGRRPLLRHMDGIRELVASDFSVFAHDRARHIERAA